MHKQSVTQQLETSIQIISKFCSTSQVTTKAVTGMYVFLNTGKKKKLLEDKLDIAKISKSIVSDK